MSYFASEGTVEILRLPLVLTTVILGQYWDPDRQQKLHPVFEELAKKYGQYWSRYFIQISWARSEETSMSPVDSSHVDVPGNEAADELAGGKVFLYLCLLSPCFFWTAGAFPCDSCMKSNAWCVTLLLGKHKLTWCRLSCSKEDWKQQQQGDEYAKIPEEG
ncbi:hypothetical protein TNCV_3374671 [Trichonephila clavipes]|nr:hypothetical protein TNCV_3374671 [Trichonephila clavipes]